MHYKILFFTIVFALILAITSPEIVFGYADDDVEISVSVDKSSYKVGDFLNIKGTGAHSYTVFANIISPNGDLIVELMFIAAKSGDFSTVWIIPRGLDDGTYIIQIKDVKKQAQTTFDIGNITKLQNSSQNQSAQCAYDPTQPHKPCDDSSGILIQDISTPFEIKLHQTIKVDGIEIEFSDIKDSRCPSDVQCVWEGQAILTFSTFNQTHHESHSFITGKVTTVNVGPYVITLNDISPYPVTTKDISEEYVAILSISKDTRAHLPPLKQIKSGVSLIDVKCNEGKHVVYKYTRMMAACVTDETENKLLTRGWALLRLGLPATDNLPRDLCNFYQGKWLAEYKECILLEIPLQCSLLGGVYNECASACRNDPDFPNVICTDYCVEVCSIESSSLEDIKNNPVVEAFYETLNSLVMPEYPDIVKNFQKMHDYKDSECFTTPNGNLFCYSSPLFEEGPRTAYVIGENGFDGEIHFDPVDPGTGYFTMKNMTRISEDTAMFTFADNNYRVGNKDRTTYEITDKFEFDAIVEKFDSFIAKCSNYEGTSVTIVQYLGVDTIDGIDYFLTWHTLVESEQGISCNYPQIIQHSLDYNFRQL